MDKPTLSKFATVEDWRVAMDKWRDARIEEQEKAVERLSDENAQLKAERDAFREGHRVASDNLERLETELKRKQISLNTVCNALTHAESQASEYRCKAEGLENELRRVKLDLEDAQKDAERLNVIANEYWKLDPFDRSTGGGDADVGWRVSQYHMGEKELRVVAEVYEDNPRAAIDAAMKGPAS